jgi:cytochrome c2
MIRRARWLWLPASLLALALLLAWAAAPMVDRRAGAPASMARQTFDPAQRERGRALLASYGCASCHQIKGLNVPQRSAGPPLEHIANNSYIAGLLPNDADALARWIMTPRDISPGTAMPDLGVSADEARAIVAYLYSQ